MLSPCGVVSLLARARAPRAPKAAGGEQKKFFEQTPNFLRGTPAASQTLSFHFQPFLCNIIVSLLYKTEGKIERSGGRRRSEPKATPLLSRGSSRPQRCETHKKKEKKMKTTPRRSPPSAFAINFDLIIIVMFAPPLLQPLLL